MCRGVWTSSAHRLSGSGATSLVLHVYRLGHVMLGSRSRMVVNQSAHSPLRDPKAWKPPSAARPQDSSAPQECPRIAVLGSGATTPACDHADRTHAMTERTTSASRRPGRGALEPEAMPGRCGTATT